MYFTFTTILDICISEDKLHKAQFCLRFSLDITISSTRLQNNKIKSVLKTPSERLNKENTKEAPVQQGEVGGNLSYPNFYTTSISFENSVRMERSSWLRHSVFRNKVAESGSSN